MATYTVVDDKRFHCACGNAYDTAAARLDHLERQWTLQREGHDIPDKYFKLYERVEDGSFVRTGPFFGSIADAELLLGAVDDSRVFEIRAIYAHTDERKAH